MPIFPPWIRAAEPAQYYGQGYGLGLREWEQQAQDARAWNQMAMQGQAQAARQALAEQEMGLREAEFGLSQQELGMRQQVEERKAQEAAQLYAARQEYQRRVQSGQDPIEALMELGPLMGNQQTAEAAAIRAQLQDSKTPFTPTEMTTPSGVPLVQLGPNRWQVAPVSQAAKEAAIANRPPTLGALVNRERLMRQYQADINKMIELNPALASDKMDPAWSDRAKSAWKAGRSAIDQIQAAMRRMPGGTTNAPGTPTMIYNERTGKLEPIGIGASGPDEDEDWGALPAEPVPNEAGDSLGY